MRAAGSPAAAFDALADQIGLGERMRSAHRIGAVRFVHSLPPGYLRTAQGPGWALVGDAGHWMDPMSTHGMTSALRDAELLVEAITSPVPVQPGTAGSYQHTRDRISRPMLETSDEIASFGWDLDRIRDVLRRMSSAMTDEVETLAIAGASSLTRPPGCAVPKPVGPRSRPGACHTGAAATSFRRRATSCRYGYWATFLPTDTGGRPATRAIGWTRERARRPSRPRVLCGFSR